MRPFLSNAVTKTRKDFPGNFAKFFFQCVVIMTGKILPQRTLATFVSRKTGMKLRIYPEHIQEYQSFLDTLPEKVKKEIKKASVCKRLINPDDCNSKCVMGFTFVLDGEQYQKCRYMAFQPTLSEENNPYIKQFLEKELQAGADYE